MARVTGVYAKDSHGFSKDAKDLIRLVAGVGVEGDAHAGAAVQHLYTAKEPSPSREPPSDSSGAE
jgi:hypothetical protein